MDNGDRYTAGELINILKTVDPDTPVQICIEQVKVFDMFTFHFSRMVKAEKTFKTNKGNTITSVKLTVEL